MQLLISVQNLFSELPKLNMSACVAVILNCFAEVLLRTQSIFFLSAAINNLSNATIFSLKFL